MVTSCKKPFNQVRNDNLKYNDIVIGLHQVINKINNLESVQEREKKENIEYKVVDNCSCLSKQYEDNEIKLRLRTINESLESLNDKVDNFENKIGIRNNHESVNFTDPYSDSSYNNNIDYLRPPMYTIHGHINPLPYHDRYDSYRMMNPSKNYNNSTCNIGNQLPKNLNSRYHSVNKPVNTSVDSLKDLNTLFQSVNEFNKSLSQFVNFKDLSSDNKSCELREDLNKLEKKLSNFEIYLNKEKLESNINSKHLSPDCSYNNHPNNHLKDSCNCIHNDHFGDYEFNKNEVNKNNQILENSQKELNSVFSNLQRKKELRVSILPEWFGNTLNFKIKL